MAQTLARLRTDGLRSLLQAPCRKRHLVGFSCKGRGFCPSCMGRRMTEGAANLVDHVLPGQVPIRKWVLTLPYPLRYPIAFDPNHLGPVLRLFTDAVSAWCRRHHPGSKTGSITVIQCASSDLRLNPHFHSLFLDGVYLPETKPGGCRYIPWHGRQGRTPTPDLWRGG